MIIQVGHWGFCFGGLAVAVDTKSIAIFASIFKVVKAFVVEIYSRAAIGGKPVGKGEGERDVSGAKIHPFGDY